MFDWVLNKPLRKVVLNFHEEVNNKNPRARCKIYLKLTIKTPEGRHCRHFGVLIANFYHISRLVSVFRLLTLNL